MSAADFLPERRSLTALRAAAAGCRGCDLYEDATQTVFGEGRAKARVVLVGETPGDQEDRQGKPFVGPAGRELDRALERAGIDRKQAYVTNAVKHFRFQERAKRRIHSKPDGRHIKACRPWLDAELGLIKPEALIVMGATAAQALLGASFRVTKERGKLLETDLAPIVVATIHPSAILRERDDDARHLQREAFTSDLMIAADALHR